MSNEFFGKGGRIWNAFAKIEFPEYSYRPYPRMLYHPQGECVVTNAGNVENMPWGPTLYNKQFSMVTHTVEDEAEEKKYLGLGWHKTMDAAKAAAEKLPAKDAKPQRPANATPAPVNA